MEEGSGLHQRDRPQARDNLDSQHPVPRTLRARIAGLKDQAPASVFLAEGSPIKVYTKKRIG